MKLVKLMFAFLSASATPALIAAVCFNGVNSPLMFLLPADYFSHLISVFVLVFLVALVHSLLLGLPVFIILSWRGQINWQSTLTSSFIIGALPVMLINVIFQGQLNPELTTIFGAFGLSGGIVFWLLWRYWIQPVI